MKIGEFICLEASVLFLVINLANSNNISSKRSCIEGIDPHDYLYIEYGKSLEIICSINDDNANFVHGFYFTQDDQRISEGEVRKLNSSTIRLFVEKAKRSKSVYACKLGNDEVCSNTVIVDGKPFPVLDFNCVSYNYQNLTCTWTAPKSYVYINYTLTYHFLDRDLRNACPKLIFTENDKRLSCSWTTNTVPQYNKLEKDFYFELIMNSVFGTTTMNKIFYHYENVISDPPIGLKYINKTAESIYLRWSIPPEMQTFPPGLQHRIMYRSQYDKGKWTIAKLIDTASLNQLKYVNFNLTDLPYAHTSYEINVMLRSLAAKQDESMWSNFSVVTTKTLSKVPKAPPLTDIGSFEIVNSTENKTNLILYWQYLPDEFKNGHDFRYFIEEVAQVGIEPVETKENYIEFKDLNATDDYMFLIWSVNNVGKSVKGSTIYIPKLSKRVPQPNSFIITPYQNGIYEFAWDEPSNISNNLSIKNYTIYWCKEDNQGSSLHHQCSDGLYWKQIPDNRKKFNITILDGIINEFAISTNTEMSSSGMIWNKCTNINNHGEGRLKSVWISRIYPTAIEITWRKQCVGNKKYPDQKNLTIVYCTIVNSTEENCNNESLFFDLETNRANITGLKPDEKYSLKISSPGGFRRSDVKRIEIPTSTLKEIPNPPTNIKIINTTNASISMVWEKPNTIKEMHIYYEIVYSNHVSNKTILLTNATKCTINNLMSSTVYGIYIRACTIKCSDLSETITAKTKAGVPSEVYLLHVIQQTGSIAAIGWLGPQYPKNDYVYEVLYKRLGGSPISVYTYDQYFKTDACNSTFIINVRAVNNFDGKGYAGPWSEDLQLDCTFQISSWIWAIIIIVLIILAATSIYLGRRVYKNYQKEIDLDIVLPSGLNSTTNTDLKNWGRPSIDESALGIKFLNEDLNLHDQYITVLPDNLVKDGESVNRSENQNLPSSLTVSNSEGEQLIKNNNSPTRLNVGTNQTQISEMAIGNNFPEGYVTIENQHSVKPNSTNDDTLPSDYVTAGEEKNISLQNTSAEYVTIGQANANDLQDLSSSCPSKVYVAIGAKDFPINHLPEEYVTIGQENAKELQDLPSGCPSEGYVAIGTENAPRNVQINHPPIGYVTIEQENAKELQDPPSSCLSEGYVAIGTENSPRNAQINHPPMGYVTIVQENAKELQDLSASCPSEGYVAIGAEDASTNHPSVGYVSIGSDSLLENLQNDPRYEPVRTENLNENKTSSIVPKNGYVILESDSSCPTLHLDNLDSNNVSSTQNSGRDIPSKEDSYVKISDMADSNSKLVQNSNGYITLPVKT